MKPKELIKILKEDGWYEVRQRGSHKQFRHPVKKGLVTIPFHNEDLDIKTLNSILKQAGLK
ncbi:type II toxin-antitoxin system HicA family toxin [Caldicellulosiruptor changbaiensis]|uniref:Type II toxin-antitoxin system HicA family toxin n=1 Tax=Caldicellulosiruptor changbaiensis TaxID=1222016 RepID=A0A3T0D549_9FIRM|nr:type II toxin-antitoxin system HicA family toxin [Caldicellulosiruptor changbaiensis]AZT90163.1 type II toxin-antitoxin system HicA family toxin [Caldicellulosiruptor changbaiensis]